MSIFKGPIKELPFISVDNFEMKYNHNSTCFFLSHCHSDHMRGLKDASFLNHLLENNYNLYCSDVTKLILQSISQIKIIQNQIKALGFGLNSVYVPAKTNNEVSYNTTVSCIPAGHCPGSVMFLFESSQFSILYTGDFRLAIGDVSKFKQLHNGRHVKKIDKIYIDATFFNPTYYQFLPRDDSISVIINDINNWLNISLRNMILLDMTANYGGEFIMQSVAEALKCKIHVNNHIYNLYTMVPEVRKYLIDKCDSTRIHAKTRQHNPECLMNVEKHFILVIKPKAAPFRCSEGETPVSIIRQRNNLIEVNYSSHSSYMEIVDFLSYLKPTDVEICTETYHSTINECKIRMSKIVLLNNKEYEEPAIKRLKKCDGSINHKPINLVHSYGIESDSDSF